VCHYQVAKTRLDSIRCTHGCTGMPKDLGIGPQQFKIFSHDVMI
jgi:hypothetical protein